MLVPASEEYTVRYNDRDRIIFDNDTKNITGEIDLNFKTLIFTVKNAGISGNETRKIEIITDNNKIEDLEKKIIRKYLKRKIFKN
jgi:hypothetical protein